jgi:hypothetical protein
LLHEPFHRARHLFDGHFRVNSVLIEQVDRFDPEPLERAFGDLLDALGPAVQQPVFLPVAGSIFQPNLVAITTWPRKGARASPTSSSLMNGP